MATGLVPPVRTSQRRRCPWQCRQQPLKGGEQVRRDETGAAAAGLLDSGLTAILRRQEVEVPEFLTLGADRASEVVRERWESAEGEQTRPRRALPPLESPRTIGEDAVPHCTGHHREKE